MTLQEKRVGQYLLLEELGKGGMGEVLLAQDETLQRRVALKRIRRDQRLDPESRARFLQEARILSQLDHPHICAIHDYLRNEDQDYLVLEFVPGEPLTTTISRGLERTPALLLAEQIADVLVVAHAAGVVHRDLKPGNVMVTPDGMVKVLDFGLAHTSGAQEPAGDGPSSSSGSYLTEQGRIMGTLCYMSPEQGRCEPATTASDMYAFGLLLQELSGGPPGHDPKLAIDVVLERTRAGVLAPSGLTGDLGALVAQLTDPAPSRRATAVEALARLRRVLDAPRRRRRLVLAAGGLLALLFGAAKYTLDLRSANREARAGWSKADELIRFQIADLYDRLEPLGRTDILLDAGRRAVEYFDERGELTPEQRLRSARAHTYLGRVERDLGSLDRAEEALRAALALTDVAAGPGEAEALERRLDVQLLLILVARDRGDLAAAKQEVTATLAACARLEALVPASPAAQSARSLAFSRQAELELYDGDVAASAAAAAAALTAAAGLADVSVLAPGRRLESEGYAHFYAGNAAFEAADMDGAEEHFRAYQTVAREVFEAHPKDRRYRLEVAMTHTNLGGVFDARGDHDAAVAEFEQAVGHFRTLVREDPANAQWQEELAVALSWLAEGHQRRGELKRSQELFEEELRLREDQSRRDPDNLDWTFKLALSHDNLAQVSEWRGEPDAAARLHTRALGLFEELTRRFPENEGWRFQLASVRRSLGGVRLRLGDPTGALPQLEAGVSELAALVAENDARDWDRSLVYGRVLLGETYRQLGRTAEAQALCTQALAATEPPWTERQTRNLRADALTLAATLASDAGRPDDVRAHCQAGLAALEAFGEGTNVPALALRARLLARLARRDELLATLDQLEACGYAEPSVMGLAQVPGQ